VVELRWHSNGRKEECCLLVLDSVTSTPQCIRQLKPRDAEKCESRSPGGPVEKEDAKIRRVCGRRCNDDGVFNLFRSCRNKK
jgi:hypothetical protein